MKRSRFTEEQVVYALRQAESGTPVADVCRQLGVAEATFYAWKKKYAHLGVSELRRLRQLEEENARLKRLVADLSLDKHMLTEALRKKSEARPAPRIGPLVSGDLLGELCAGLSLGPVQSGCLVSEEPGEGSIRPPTPHSRSRACPTAVRVSADLGVAATGGLVDQSEAGAPAVSAGWLATAHAGPSTQTYRFALWGRHRSRPGRRSAGAWISCMIPSRLTVW